MVLSCLQNAYYLVDFVANLMIKNASKLKAAKEEMNHRGTENTETRFTTEEHGFTLKRF